MNGEKIATLLERYQLGKCTPEEMVLVERWFSELGEKKDTLSNMSPDLKEAFLSELRSDILNINQKNDDRLKSRNKKLWVRIAAVAAVFLLVLGGTIYLYQQQRSASSAKNNIHFNDILPGTNKAVLTLVNGKRIVLNDAKIGDLENQSGVRIIKASDSRLVFNFSGTSQQSGPVRDFNKIETPKGGEYEINLSDGTKVWLNAASSLRFPPQFSRSGYRTVALQGEGYFEVAKNEKQPFVVITDQQKIQVLGTHFNVNSYADEPATKTTLIEGAISITRANETNVADKNKIILKPGEQAVLNKVEIKVSTVNADDAIAWKNGLFSFKDADLETVMKTISRWYSFEVEYEGTLPQKEFTGEIHRDLKLSELLEVLSYYKVHFRLENKKIIVSR